MTNKRKKRSLSPKVCAAGNCQDPVPAGRSKYCDLHGRRASALWKKRWRVQQFAEYQQRKKAGLPAQMYYLQGWSSVEAYRARCREGMRQMRARRRSSTSRLTPGRTRAHA